MVNRGLGLLKTCNARNQMRLKLVAENNAPCKPRYYATKLDTPPLRAEEQPFSIKTFQVIYQRQSFRFKILFSLGLFIFSCAGLVFADWLEKKMPAPPKKAITEEEEWLTTKSDIKAKLIKELENE